MMKNAFSAKQREARFLHILMENETGGGEEDMKEKENRPTPAQELQLIGLVLSLIGAALQLIGYFEEVTDKKK
ncbi:hypothetical protein A6764_08415 [Brevibacillus sp. WF146]|nr:hypothetical protein [Brevibacillus sp. WF146]UYZ14942.1 hypothetical protein A6764_08415 [Brevibacillus sp. WF146]